MEKLAAAFNEYQDWISNEFSLAIKKFNIAAIEPVQKPTIFSSQTYNIFFVDNINQMVISLMEPGNLELTACNQPHWHLCRLEYK
jgi:hypothetical protein